jgi:hypothetical protein
MSVQPAGACRSAGLGRILRAMSDAISRLNAALEGRYRVMPYVEGETHRGSH